MSFIKTNGDVIHPEQLAESAWASAATQLYALFIGPVIVAILTGTLIKAEFHSQMVDMLRSRGQHAGYKIAALIVSLAALGVILSAALVAGGVGWNIGPVTLTGNLEIFFLPTLNKRIRA
ncbi:hypothetical protein [Corynebacterium propinquum]|uniref:hypothetical protein n=1 Tax=Corynebacterium propinquum TaxID=43769 RepID=UPI000F8894EE|nr:hypothetical protein [Corynebacterium propinquum]